MAPDKGTSIILIENKNIFTIYIATLLSPSTYIAETAATITTKTMNNESCYSAEEFQFYDDNQLLTVPFPFTTASNIYGDDELELGQLWGESSTEGIHRGAGEAAAASQLCGDDDDLLTWFIRQEMNAGELPDSMPTGGGGSKAVGEMMAVDEKREMRENAEAAALAAALAAERGAAIVTQGSCISLGLDAEKVFDDRPQPAQREPEADLQPEPEPEVEGGSAQNLVKKNKRKEKNTTEDVDDECGEWGNKRKHARHSTSTRKRASVAHNLTERRRRKQINKKMKSLQDLIPRSTKVHKASMLTNAVAYVKSLQKQVQMLSSIICNIMQFLPSHAQSYVRMLSCMGVNMGMASGLGVGTSSMAQPVFLQGSVHPYYQANLPPQYGPIYPANVDQSKAQAFYQCQPASNPVTVQGSNLVQNPSPFDPYYSYPALHRVEPRTQSQTVAGTAASAEAGAAKKTVAG